MAKTAIPRRGARHARSRSRPGHQPDPPNGGPHRRRRL